MATERKRFILSSLAQTCRRSRAVTEFHKNVARCSTDLWGDSTVTRTRTHTQAAAAHTLDTCEERNTFARALALFCRTIVDEAGVRSLCAQFHKYE